MKFAIKVLGAALVSTWFLAPALAADFKSHHAVSSARLSPGAEVSLNPQPLPPCCSPDRFALVGKGSRGAAVSLNPQPLPPAGIAGRFDLVGKSNPGAAVSLNPQPLPPGGLGFGARRMLAQ